MRLEKGASMQRTMAILLVVFLWVSGAAAAERLRIGYSSISGAYIGIWVAHDAGFFAKEGLDNQVILIPNGTQLAQVTVAGEVDIAALGGAAAIAAGFSGADFKVIGATVNKLIFSMFARPDIKRVEELKGKKSASPVSAPAPTSRPVTLSSSITSIPRKTSFFCSWERSLRSPRRLGPGPSMPAWYRRRRFF